MYRRVSRERSRVAGAGRPRRCCSSRPSAAAGSKGAVVLLWATLPLALISVGTSKLYHYAYPFLPPLALAAGYLVALLVHACAGRRCGRLWSASKMP